MPGTLKYDALLKKYERFENAQAYILLNGKQIGGKNTDMFVGDINVELTSGFEASVATFRIYNTYDMEKAKFRFSDVEKQAILGVAMTVYLGYIGQLEPVFTGFVAGVSFGYDGVNPPYIEITGMDAKGVMMASCYANSLTAKSYGEAVKEILQRTAYEKMKSSDVKTGMILDVKVTDTPDKKQGGEDKASAETIEMVSESDYEFIIKAAKKFNYDFFIDRGTVYFRKAKSDTSPLIKLGIGEGILTFNLEYSLTGMVETIEARSMDVGQGRVITSKSKYDKTLSTSSKAKALIGGSRRVFIDPTIYTQEQADARVASLMEDMSYRLGYLECECIGIPEIVPGYFAEVKLDSPADNSFYITNVTHTIKDNGVYRTKVIGKVDTVKG
ncbi:MAG: hypothetical protein FWD34_01175 [Oscillospiraceae bacterium]|nr:hypothetical protein [Oscillospiraceae bacterium]